MSHNLTCEQATISYQTPSVTTFFCLYRVTDLDIDGRPREIGRGGKQEWRETLDRYLIWLRHELMRYIPSSYTSEEAPRVEAERSRAIADWNFERARLLDAARKHGKLDFDYT